MSWRVTAGPGISVAPLAASPLMKIASWRPAISGQPGPCGSGRKWLTRTNSSVSALFEDGHAEAVNDNPAVPQHPAIPPDDPRRRLAIARPDDPALAHLGLVGDTYTILLTGDDTAGRYTLIDMHVPPAAVPPPHRHDFEEMFTVLDGEVEPPSVASTWSPGRRDRQRAGQRTACLHQRLRQASTAPVHVLTARAGRVLPRGQRARREPGPKRRPHLTRPPRRRSSRIPGTCPAIPHRIATTLNAAL